MIGYSFVTHHGERRSLSGELQTLPGTIRTREATKHRLWIPTSGGRPGDARNSMETREPTKAFPPSPQPSAGVRHTQARTKCALLIGRTKLHLQRMDEVVTHYSEPGMVIETFQAAACTAPLHLSDPRVRKSDRAQGLSTEQTRFTSKEGAVEPMRQRSKIS